MGLKLNRLDLSGTLNVSIFLFFNFLLLISTGLNYLYHQNNYFLYESPMYIKSIPAIIFTLLFFNFVNFKNFKKNKIVKWHLIFLVTNLILSTLHVLFKRNAFESLHFDIINLGLWSLAVYILPSIIKEEKDFNFFLKNFSFSVFVITILSLILFYFGINFDNRFISFFKDPLRAGFVIVLEILVFFNPLRSRYSYLPPLFYVTLLLLIISLILSGSFSAIFSLIFAFCLALFFLNLTNLYEVKYLPNLKKITFCFFIFYIMYRFGVFDYFIKRFNLMFFLEDSNAPGFSSISSRIQQYFSLFYVLKKMTILEIFLGKFGNEHYLTTDSFYLQLFYNSGLIGLSSYLIFFFSAVLLNLNLLQNYINNRNKSSSPKYFFLVGMLSLFCILIFFSFFLVALPYQFPFNYLVFLLVGALISLDNLKVN